MARDPASEGLLRADGAERVITGRGVSQTRSGPSDRTVSKVLELVGVTTPADSLRCVRQGGTACMRAMSSLRTSATTIVCACPPGIGRPLQVPRG
jgi:hypothetical protein